MLCVCRWVYFGVLFLLTEEWDRMTQNLGTNLDPAVTPSYLGFIIHVPCSTLDLQSPVVVCDVTKSFL